jgi:hypothetical protein
MHSATLPKPFGLIPSILTLIQVVAKSINAPAIWTRPPNLNQKRAKLITVVEIATSKEVI